MAVKLKHLEAALSGVAAFAAPKVALEQYPTSAHLASHMLFTAATQHDDVVDCSVLDLGCGTGMLGIAAGLLGAGAVVGVDVDAEALAQAVQNCEEKEVAMELIQGDLRHLALRPGCVDTVVSNPPFGTRARGMDSVFFLQAARLARSAVYLLYKSSTRSHFERLSAQIGADMRVVAELRFDIPRMYAFHRQKTVDVAVDLVRFDVSRVSEEAARAALLELRLRDVDAGGLPDPDEFAEDATGRARSSGAPREEGARERRQRGERGRGRGAGGRRGRRGAAKGRKR